MPAGGSWGASPDSNDDSVSEGSELAPLFWSAAAALLGHAIQLSNGHFHDDAFTPLKWMLAFASAAVILPRLLSRPVRTESLTVACLCAALIYQFGQLVTSSPGIYLSALGENGLLPFHYGIGAAIMLCGALASRSRAKAFSVPAACLLAVHFTLGVWVIQASPEPHIDTYYFQRDGIQALLEGLNPYAIAFKNIYSDGSAYGPGMVVDGRLNFGYVYPPLSLLLALPGALLGGDIRYSQLAALTGTGAFMLAIGAGHRVAALATALFLFTPRGFFVLEQSWTEPYLLCLVASVLWSALRAPRALPYAVGLTLVAKQHMALLLPLFWLLPNMPRSLRKLSPFVLRAGTAALLVTLPLALWNPRAFYRSAIVLQFKQPFRGDALSFAALRLAEHRTPLPAYTPFVLALGGLGLALWRAPRTGAGFAGSAALVYALFFVAAKQAFCNYYFFVIGLLCFAVAASATRVGPGSAQAAAESVIAREPYAEHVSADVVRSLFARVRAALKRFRVSALDAAAGAARPR
jgi:hypothetical protein